jgi:hypothetical protein
MRADLFAILRLGKTIHEATRNVLFVASSCGLVDRSRSQNSTIKFEELPTP